MKATIRRSLALVALAAGAFAALAGDPRPPLRDDEIAAIDLAKRLRDRHEGVRLVDTRAADAIAQDRLPGARALIDADLAGFSGDTVVIYADGNVDPGVVDALPRSSGARYLRLRGGLRAWHDEVLFPVLRADATAAQAQRFEARAQLSRYFGGTPRRLDPGAESGRPRSRQGC